MAVGDRVRRERTLWGWTQRELADRTGIKRDVISKIETGDRNVSGTELVALATVLEVRADELGRPAAMVDYRVNRDLPATQDAIAWFERCVDNSLFVRELAEL